MGQGIVVLEKMAREIMIKCKDRRIKQQLEELLNRIPTQSAQLRMIASVKAMESNDFSADTQLSVCAQNLMQTVISVIQTCEVGRRIQS